MRKPDDGDRWTGDRGPRTGKPPRYKKIRVPPELYTREQAADHFGVSTDTIDARVRAGVLVRRQIGERLYVEILTPGMQARSDRWHAAAQACARGERDAGAVDGNRSGRWHNVTRLETDTGIVWADPFGDDVLDTRGE